MKTVLIALCWLVSLGILSLHAESFDGRTMPPVNRQAVDSALSGHPATVHAVSLAKPQRFVAINFSAPLHLAGQQPATGAGPIRPAGLSGNPQVVHATPALPSQPLLLNTEPGNGPCCYEEGIQVLVAEESSQYVVSFDLASQQLGDAFNQFQLWLNDDSAPLLRFQPDYLVMLDGVGAIARFRDNHLLHVQLSLDLQARQMAVSINGETLYIGALALTHLYSLQFLLTAEGGITADQVNPEAAVALDNIVVANGAYHYANLQASLQRTAPTDDGQMEVISRVQNISAHAARDVVVSHLLPAGAHLITMDSEQLTCELMQDQVICRGESLAAFEEAAVSLRLSADQKAPPQELTVIATSQSDEIDNVNNREAVRMGGSSTLLMLAALMLLWLMRGWRDGR